MIWGGGGIAKMKRKVARKQFLLRVAWWSASPKTTSLLTPPLFFLSFQQFKPCRAKTGRATQWETGSSTSPMNMTRARPASATTASRSCARPCCAHRPSAISGKPLRANAVAFIASNRTTPRATRRKTLSYQETPSPVSVVLNPFVILFIGKIIK